MKREWLYGIGIAIVVIGILVLVFIPKDKEPDLAALKAVAERTATETGNNPWIIGAKDVAPTHGNLGFNVVKEWTIGEVVYKQVDVTLDINSGYASVCAISMVVNFDPECVNCIPLDNSTVHPDLVAALKQSPGAMMSNIVAGKFIFAFYCITPADFTVNGGVNTILSLTFANVKSPTTLSFDEGQGQNEFSLDGRNHLSLTFNTIEL